MRHEIITYTNRESKSNHYWEILKNSAQKNLIKYSEIVPKYQSDLIQFLT